VQLSTSLTKGKKASTNALASPIVLCIFQFAATTGILIPFALLPLISFSSVSNRWQVWLKEFSSEIGESQKNQYGRCRFCEKKKVAVIGFTAMRYSIP